MSNTYTGPGSQYGQPGSGGWTWGEGANEQWSQDHRINPQTGMIEGPYPIPPADIARGYQALHDRAIWERRQRYMQGGIDFAQGALGLLQSYRPDGSAALESGQYNQVAGLMFQRAAMTQPLDLLGDLRRHEMAISQQNANRARERQMAVQIGQAVATLASAYIGGAGGAAVGLIGSIGGGIASSIANRQAQGGGGAIGGAYQEQGGFWGNTGSGSDFWQTGGSEGQTGGAAQGAQAGAQAGAQGGQAAPAGLEATGAPGAAGGSQDQGSALQSQLSPEQAQVQQQTQAKQIAQQTEQQGGLAGGMGMTASPQPGVDGNFSGNAYAASGALAMGQNPMERVALTNYAADLRESDPFYRTLGVAINGLWQRTLELV